MEQPKTFQLEIFNGKVYTPHMRASDPRANESLADLGRTIGKPWRVVLPEKAWPARPSHRRGTVNSPCSVTDGSNERMRATVGRYLDWARTHGLKTVTVYRDSYAERQAAAFERRVVDVADFPGNPPAAELEG
jgi:hypothetical protein